MDSFYKYLDKLNGPAIKATEYDLLDFEKQATSGKPMANTEKGIWQLTPLSQEDMSSTASEDAIDWFTKHGKNTMALGAPLSDMDFKKYTGQK